ncbi:hypothetical protein UFOVP469_6 [uncultured Caudovirales phage]|uniref:Uncharacterized protein n=1 Tax=uncultured Caudovirales phage TaxID=2100421 RepID=A0A6J5MKD3_9CAUD|nr:hypothetical protein UFOVP469_6 [uncultured Caudovirales phage]CAB4190096.1 hypothetical protein UFOVP1200_36 [uncultured Caudovirales phage]
MTTSLSLLGLSITSPEAIGAKPVPGMPTYGSRIAEFDTWRPGYGGMSVEVLIADTTDRATLYSDPFLAVSVANPQTLLSYTDAAGVIYGKWEVPVYTNVPYRLLINETDNGGITRPPILTLAGEDASLALVASSRGDFSRTLETVVDLTIHAAMFGAIGGDAGTAISTATLVAAIGAAAAQGGGYVQLPAGSVEIEALTLAQGVRLLGHGQSATTLVCRDAEAIITLGGDGAGIEALTLDGQISASGSVGVRGDNTSEPWLRDVLIRRFDIGTLFHGATSVTWHNIDWSDCRIGAYLRGDANGEGDNSGGPVENIRLIGGSVSLCSEHGLLVEFHDETAHDISLQGVGFVTNVGPALHLIGVRGVVTDGCYWTGNTKSITIEDADDATYADLNTTQRINIRNGRINAGEITFDGACVGVSFDKVDFVNVDFILDLPTTVIVLRDCTEDVATTSTGDTKKLARQTTFDVGEWTGITTDATPTAAWSLEMEPGETGLFTARALGVGRNAITYGNFWVVAGAARPGATLNFNLQTGNYTAGLVVSGASSGASARITAVTQAAGSGTLTLRDITGTFVSGELLTDTSTGSARASGGISTSSTALDSVGSDPIRPDATTGTGWDVEFTVSGAMIQLMVTGEASVTIDWTVRVEKMVG